MVLIFSSLASVSPPNIWYRLQLPQDVADNAHLSALQLEAVVYASQKHETFLPNGNRAGFLIGKGQFILYVTKVELERGPVHTA